MFHHPPKLVAYETRDGIFLQNLTTYFTPKLKRSETTFGNKTSVLLYQTFDLKYVDPICFQESYDAS